MTKIIKNIVKALNISIEATRTGFAIREESIWYLIYMFIKIRIISEIKG
ncbi:hypothetical protein KL86DYS1_30819 [uncultured Dysgonomonas sp.]|uniref:Uncharacterized protein n=1 Tax=uncultured Dysgonomonas sp. TaxID=206096 RepID=A0A212JXZ9_9BACT|nr:hypothetical protein KL86DYS1_30819 [uncultured Dysgonomonas sp.]